MKTPTVYTGLPILDRICSIDRHETNERLVSKETVVLRQWGSETINYFGIKQVDKKSQISTMKR